AGNGYAWNARRSERRTAFRMAHIVSRAPHPAPRMTTRRMTDRGVQRAKARRRRLRLLLLKATTADAS
ncbi:hypothetical protein, partial [Streptomyces sp. NPDC054787]